MPADPVEVTLADSIAPDMQALATTADLMRRAEAASTETLVRHLHPDWDEPQIAEEVDRIMRESGRTVTDPDLFTGTPEPNPEPDGQGGGPVVPDGLG